MVFGHRSGASGRALGVQPALLSLGFAQQLRVAGGAVAGTPKVQEATWLGMGGTRSPISPPYSERPTPGRSTKDMCRIVYAIS